MPCSVVAVQRDVIKVEYGEGKRQEWVAADSDRLMPKGSMANSPRWSFLAEIDAINSEK